MPKSKETVLFVPPDGFRGAEVVNYLKIPTFDWQIFNALKKEAQKAIIIFATLNSWITQQESAQIQLMIEDPSYGENELLKRIIDKIKKAAIDIAQRLESQATPHPEQDREGKLSTQPRPAERQADWDFFTEKTKDLTADELANIVKVFLLSKPNPFAGKLWKLVKAKDQLPALKSVAEIMIESPWVDLDLKTKIWTDLKEKNSANGFTWSILFRAAAEGNGIAENVQIEALDFFEITELDLGNQVKSILKVNPQAGDLQEALCSKILNSKYVQSRKDLSETLDADWLPDQKAKIRERLRDVFNQSEDIGKMSIWEIIIHALKSEDWELMEKHCSADIIKQSDPRMFYSQNISVISHPNCPADLRGKYVKNIVENLDIVAIAIGAIRDDAEFDDLKIILRHCNPQQIDIFATWIIDTFFNDGNMTRNFGCKDPTKTEKYFKQKRDKTLEFLETILSFAHDEKIKEKVISILAKFNPDNVVIDRVLKDNPNSAPQLEAIRDGLSEAIRKLLN